MISLVGIENMTPPSLDHGTFKCWPHCMSCKPPKCDFLARRRTTITHCEHLSSHRSEVAHVIDQEAANRKQLLTSAPSPDLHYMLSLVDLLATCAEVSAV